MNHASPSIQLDLYRLRATNHHQTDDKILCNNRRACLSEPARYSNTVHSNHPKAVTFTMKPPVGAPRFPDKVRRSDGAPTLGDVMVRKAMDRQKIEPWEEVPAFHLQLLASAVEAKDASVVSCLWWMLKRYDCEGMPSLGMQHITITVDLLHFLLVRVQVPDLVCMMLVQYVEGTPPPSRHWAHEIARNRTANSGMCELAPLVATLMDAVLFVPRMDSLDLVGSTEESRFGADVNHYQLSRNGWESASEAFKDLAWNPTPSGVGRAKGDGDTWWHATIVLLFSGLESLAPKRVYKHKQGSNGVVMSFTLLDRAVLCSEISTDPVESILKHCSFTVFEMAEAACMAISDGNVRGSTLVDVVRIIYTSLCSRLQMRRLHRESQALSTVWCYVVRNASGYVPCVLSSTNTRRLQIPTSVWQPATANPTSEAQVSSRHPDVGVALIDALVQVHVDWMAENSADAVSAACLERVVADALLVVVRDPFKTHLVETLLFLVDRHKFKLTVPAEIGICLRGMLLNHPTVWNLFVPHLLGDDAKLNPRFLPQTLVALRDLISKRHRVGVRLLLTTLREGGSFYAEKVRSDKAILSLYIEQMCKSPIDFSAKAYGHDHTLTYIQMAQRDFKQLLECAAYTEEQLAAALHFAGKRCSSIAVEVRTVPSNYAFRTLSIHFCTFNPGTRVAALQRVHAEGRSVYAHHPHCAARAWRKGRTRSRRGV